MRYTHHTSGWYIGVYTETGTLQSPHFGGLQVWMLSFHYLLIIISFSPFKGLLAGSPSVVWRRRQCLPHTATLLHPRPSLWFAARVVQLEHWQSHAAHIFIAAWTRWELVLHRAGNLRSIVASLGQRFVESNSTYNKSGMREIVVVVVFVVLVSLPTSLLI